MWITAESRDLGSRPREPLLGQGSVAVSKVIKREGPWGVGNEMRSRELLSCKAFCCVSTLSTLVLSALAGAEGRRRTAKSLPWTEPGFQ